jgi:hypothetical protein
VKFPENYAGGGKRKVIKREIVLGCNKTKKTNFAFFP